ncbi:MAG: hypothetical protein U1F67_06595 [Rubrivivax sp.]
MHGRMILGMGRAQPISKRASTSTRNYRNVVTPQLAISILAREGPIDGRARGIAGALPEVDLAAKGWPIGEPAIQALTIEDADFDLRHVQPARVLGRVVELHSTQEAIGGVATKDILEGLPEVNVQVVQHDA